MLVLTGNELCQFQQVMNYVDFTLFIIIQLIQRKTQQLLQNNFYNQNINQRISHPTMLYQASPIKGLESIPFRNNSTYSPVYPINAINPINSITPFIDQSQRLNELLHQRKIQITKLYEENTLLRRSYQEQITTYKLMVQSLEKELSQRQMGRSVQLLRIEQNFNQVSLKQSQNLKQLHSHQVQFLLKQIAQQKSSFQTLNLKIQLQQQQSFNLKQSYQRQLSTNTLEINTLNKLISTLQSQSAQQIRQLSTHRQLQKSRTNTLISSRRQSTQFIDRQVRKLNQEVMEKTILIQGLSRQLNREKRKLQEQERQLKNQIDQIKQDYQQQIQQSTQAHNRIEKALKLEITEIKQYQIKYIQQIQSLKTQVNDNHKIVSLLKQNIQSRQQQILNLKKVIQKTRQQHSNQINNLMKQRRKSRSNIGSSRSIISMKDSSIIPSSPPHNTQSNQLQKYGSEFQVGSGRLQKNLHPIKQQTSPHQQIKDYSRELADSNLQQQFHQTQLQRAVYHYDNLIQQLKKNHQAQVDLLKINQKKFRGKLKEKEQELLDILMRFSPLVKIHAKEKTIEQDRKERLERHWKADVALLEVMLTKYKIQLF